MQIENTTDIYKLITNADIEVAEDIRNLVQSGLWTKFNSYICYRGNSLNFCSKKGDRLYIRLVHTEDKKVFVDLSSVLFIKENQHKGHLTKLYETLKASDKVKGIMISSVISKEMHNFCKKNNMNYDKQYNTYWVALRD